MSDLVEFLRARLDEDERVAKLVPQPYRLYVSDKGRLAEPLESEGQYAKWADGEDRMPNHINNWELAYDPARVLAEVEAKRRLMERHPGATDEDECPGCGATLMGTWQTGPGETCPELADLASVYASHDEYDESWRP